MEQLDNCNLVDDALKYLGSDERNIFFDKIAFFSRANCISNDDKAEIYQKLKNSLSNVEAMDMYVYIYIVSMMIHLAFEKEDLVNLCEYVRNADMDVSFKYYVFRQLEDLVFRNPTKLRCKEGFIAISKLLFEIVEEAKKQMPEELLTPIPVEERNDNLVVVITSQFLSLYHGPTKTAMDRCSVLIKKLGKKVLLINTAETGYSMNEIPFYCAVKFNYNKEITEGNMMKWMGVEIPFFQCEDSQLNLPVIEALLGTIRQLKPGKIIEIGIGSILASLADYMIPVLSDGLAPSSLEYSATTCQTLFRKLNDEDLLILKELNIPVESIIYSEFTSSLKDRTLKVCREELGIPMETFAIAIVGARLDADIDDEFIKLMEKVCDDNTVFVLLGKISEEKFEKYSLLKEHIHCYGFVEDTRAYLEICDLYLNPRRMGAGTSSVESLDVGVPVITPNYGDVSVNVGENFISENDEMTVELVNRYRTDKEFYKSQSAKARERGKHLQNSSKLFSETLDRFNEYLQNRQNK